MATDDVTSGTPPDSPAASGRTFQFRCLRCSSVLEARSSQCGRPGQCPTCEAVFTVPAIDPRSGLAVSHADPGDDGENPTPVHAYAAAGAKAPRIIRQDDDSTCIQCPRCGISSPIVANACFGCGLPFTLEGATRPIVTGQARQASLYLTLGILSIPMAFCGGIGVVPGVIALFGGLHSWASATDERPRIIAGAILGVVGCAIATAVLLSILS